VFKLRYGSWKIANFRSHAQAIFKKDPKRAEKELAAIRAIPAASW